MDSPILILALECLLVCLVASLYSSVGHGGASGYLALMALLAVPADEAATTALLLNVVVASIAAVSFIRAGNLPQPALWTALATSVPLAFIGGSLQIPERRLEQLLAAVLVYAAVTLAVRGRAAEPTRLEPARWPVLVAAGGVIGLLSGIVGIGGGIFLSPLVVLKRWGRLRQAATLSAGFIVANSLAGLAARALSSNIAGGPAWPLAICAAIGGLAGSRFGARFAPPYVLRVLLAAVMLAATAKLLLSE